MDTRGLEGDLETLEHPRGHLTLATIAEGTILQCDTLHLGR